MPYQAYRGDNNDGNSIKWEAGEGLRPLAGDGSLVESASNGGRIPWWRSTTCTPAVEVADTNEAIIVKAQVPGVSKDQIEVDSHEEATSLKGEMKEEEKKEEKNYSWCEFRLPPRGRWLLGTIPFIIGYSPARGWHDGCLLDCLSSGQEGKKWRSCNGHWHPQRNISYISRRRGTWQTSVTSRTGAGRL